MKQQFNSSRMWGSKASSWWLYLTASVLLFAWLGGREIWTQEHRWIDIVGGMFARQDFFHPYLGEQNYYDKPLLSYWLIAAIVKVTGSLSMWAARLPSALSGLLTIWSIVRLGKEMKDRQLGLLAGWMLLTTFYFLFWARTSSADMLNVAGTLLAVTWYMMKRDTATFYDYAIFFMIIALTSLCKGLVGAVVPTIAVLTDIIMRGTWRRYLSWTVILSVLPGLIIYITPFMISSMTNHAQAYAENGLYYVYRENILRYFQPFDHVAPIYTYFVYLPIYMLPWALFFIPALVSLPSRWKKMSMESRWLVLTVGLLFAFFTVSGSRRSYYVLPLVPFAILMTADWLVSARRSMRWVSAIIVVMVPLLLVGVDYLPAWYNNHYGAARFAQAVFADIKQPVAFTEDNVLMLDAESKLNYYLGLPLTLKNYALPVDRENLSADGVAVWWPILKQYDLNKTIIVTRKMYLPFLQPYLKDHRMVSIPDFVMPYVHPKSENDSVVLIPIYMR